MYLDRHCLVFTYTTRVGSKKNTTKGDVDQITERLSTTYIQSQLVSESDQAKATDILSKDPMNEKDRETVVDRLHTTHTISSSGEGQTPRPSSSRVEREPVSEEEMKVGIRPWRTNASLSSSLPSSSHFVMRLFQVSLSCVILSQMVLQLPGLNQVIPLLLSRLISFHHNFRW